MLYSLLCLLVLLTPVDDLWARTTPEPGASAWAADNNEFLDRVGDGFVALPPEPDVCPGWLDSAAGPLPAVPPPAAPAGPALLYLLMSLQR